MSKEAKMIGHLKKGNSIKFEKEELEELRKDFDLDTVMKFINHNNDKIYGDYGALALDDPKFDSLLTEEKENYYFDQFYESYDKITTGSTDYPKELKNMWNAIRVLYHHYETCSDEPMRDIKDRIMTNYGDYLFDEMDVFKTLYTAMKDVFRLTTSYNNSRYLAMLLREYAKGVYDSMKSKITPGSEQMYSGTIYSTVYITSIIMQYSAILTELHPTVAELDNAIEQMNQVCYTSMLITLVDIDEYLTELEDNDHYFTSEEDDMINYYTTFCSEMKYIIDRCPIFTAENHALLSHQRVSGESDNNEPIYNLKIDDNGEVVIMKDDYPIEDKVNDIIRVLTKVGSAYSPQLIGDDVRLVFTENSPEIEDIITIMGVDSINSVIDTLQTYLDHTNFTHSDIMHTFVFSTVQLKLSTVIDILTRVYRVDAAIPKSVNRDKKLYSIYTKLCKMMSDIEDCLSDYVWSDDDDDVYFPAEHVMHRLETYYCANDLQKYNFDNMKDYIFSMDSYISQAMHKFTNVYDISMTSLSVAYIEYIRALFDIKCDLEIVQEDDVENTSEESDEEILYLSYDNDVVTLHGSGYTLEDNVNFVIQTLTGTDDMYRVKDNDLVDTSLSLLFDCTNIEEYTESTLKELQEVLSEYLRCCKFDDYTVTDSVNFAYSVVKMKLGVVISLLDNLDNMDVNPNNVDGYALERDSELAIHFAALSDMLNDIENIMDARTGYKKEKLLPILEDDYHFANTLQKYECDSIKDLLYIIDARIGEVLADEENKGVNPYDVCMCNVLYEYVRFLDDTLYGTEDSVEEENLDDAGNSEIFEDIVAYTGGIGHFTNVLTQVMSDKLSLVNPMGIRLNSSDRNYINIMKGLLCIEEDMSVDEGLNVSAFTCTMIESIPKAHIYNLKNKVSKHDPESRDYDESLNMICEETLQSMINICDRDISEFLKHKPDELGDDMVSKLFLTNMKAYYNIIQLFKDSYDDIVH